MYAFDFVWILWAILFFILNIAGSEEVGSKGNADSTGADPSKSNFSDVVNDIDIGGPTVIQPTAIAAAANGNAVKVDVVAADVQTDAVQPSAPAPPVEAAQPPAAPLLPIPAADVVVPPQPVTTVEPPPSQPAAAPPVQGQTNLLDANSLAPPGAAPAQ